MKFFNLRHFLRINKIMPLLFTMALFFVPGAANAFDLVDSLNLTPFVPIVLDAMMSIATSGYKFFVGNGDGIIYLLVYGFFIMSIVLYLIKMYIPKTWVSFLGFSGGGEMFAGPVKGETIAKNILKPALRTIIATTILLQIKPVYVTNFLVNPFLHFGAAYTHEIVKPIHEPGALAEPVKVSQEIIDQEWISETSYKFMVQPVADLSHENGKFIKLGFQKLTRGLRDMLLIVPHGGHGFLNVTTGLLLIITFTGCNFFMALLIIQAIFNFGMALILYPFQVLTYVSKDNEKWFDIWPAFSGIIKALQQMIITMIASAFILCINVAMVRALMSWMSNTEFVSAAEGVAASNLSTASGAFGFGKHSVVWLSAILTFFLILNIFNMTRDQLKAYAGSGMDDLYNKASADTKKLWGKGKEIRTATTKVRNWFKKK